MPSVPEPSVFAQDRLRARADCAFRCWRSVRPTFCIVFWLSFLTQLATSASAQTLLRATLDPQPITLPIVDGTEIRFRRLSTFEGLLQTKVAQIVQGNLGLLWFGTQH